MAGVMMDQAAREQAASWTVPAEWDEIRLDAFARRCLPHLSRWGVEEVIRCKSLWINGRVGKKGEKLKGGDRLVFRGSDDWLERNPIPDAQLSVPVVYEDSSLLVVDKPAQMATHGFSARDTMTLANFIAARYPGLVSVGMSRWEPGLVHRLDRETSGLVLIAKTQTAFENLRRQFRRREIRKIYLALVWGIADEAGSIAGAIAHDGRDKRIMRALTKSAARAGEQKSWRAVTRFRTLTRSKGLSLLELEMATGVTHQIRVHLAACGHPIVGDLLYGPEKRERFGLQRHFLHAARLELRHPDNGRWVSVKAPLPSDLRDALDRLGIGV